MIFNESVDEVVGVVVSFLESELEVQFGLSSCLFQYKRLEESFEVVRRAHVNESGRADIFGSETGCGSRFDEVAAVIRSGLLLPVSIAARKVESKRLGRQA